MTVAQDLLHRSATPSSLPPLSLEDKFEVIKDIGDGSFGSVVLARVRTAGSNVARRGSVVSASSPRGQRRGDCAVENPQTHPHLRQIAIKTMKKTFESFAPCLELREVIFLRSLPNHAHLVPALDIFLDPYSKKLHICMEYMDGNLYQLMKAREHKCLDGASVKSILFQILTGLEHIHSHHFFHRDIKPENILVSTSAPQDASTAFRRYSAIVTPPSTPPVYTVKIADFGLARETHSKLPYTTYVSTRWYRAPEVLLRAGEYSAPVDIWAIGAMAVEIATLKPLFPGGNEVDQVWRVCEIMGSPGNWYSKSGAKVGGGDWREGTRLAQKLGFSFPKMAPHAIDTILHPPQWPASLCHFVTWCLMWDPRNRPTSTQALNHQYFSDAVDPLRPKSSASKILGRKQSDLSQKASKESSDMPSPITLSKPSWFRKSLIGRDTSPIIPQYHTNGQTLSPRPSPPIPSYSTTTTTITSISATKSRPNVDKRATWTTGLVSSKAAPIPILPTIRPISPLLTAQASGRAEGSSYNGGNARANGESSKRVMDDKAAKKIGRQLSVASHGNHYADIHRQQAEQALNGNGGLASPPSGHKESFFSHLRKRARRLSGRHQSPLSPNSDDIEASAGCGPWSSNRSSIAADPPAPPPPPPVIIPTNIHEFKELDDALQNVRYSLDQSSPNVGHSNVQANRISQPGTSALKRHHSIPQPHQSRSVDNLSSVASPGPISSRTRRALQMSTHPVHRYETPDEGEEISYEVLDSSTIKAAKRQERNSQVYPSNKNSNVYKHSSIRTPFAQSASNVLLSNPYPTPSPSAKRNSVYFGVQNQDQVSPTRPLEINNNKTASTDHVSHPKWPTPPYEENEWASAAAASIYAAGALYR
ncbi:MAG: hypothetical protein M1829_006671 [Trizodia sp. TS-e1964]|nr:MAG: hypothetical protein M1829_006671 [Trizodia sp. TS-e1964]